MEMGLDAPQILETDYIPIEFDWLLKVALKVIW
jgi:hypothetical protein